MKSYQRLIISFYSICLFFCYGCGDEMQNTKKPEILDIYTVKPDILVLKIKSNHFEHGRQTPYEKRENDSIDRRGHHKWVIREGKYIGLIAGKDEKIIYRLPQVTGEALDTSWVFTPGNYKITSSTDLEFSKGLNPVKIYCKSKPCDLALTKPDVFEPEMIHVVYLQLPKPLTLNSDYKVMFNNDYFTTSNFTYDPVNVRTEAIHVNQIGFHPKDPVKIAYLSCWKGSGGETTYNTVKQFSIVDVYSNEKLFTGNIILSKSKDEHEGDIYNTNYNLTDVYKMDFHEFEKPGDYKIHVAGIGCSYPFSINDTIWANAFRVSTRGFYHHRSGIKIGEPYTNYKRPRCFLPDDGMKIYTSTAPLMNTNNGLNTNDTNFGNLVAGRTENTLENVWGAHMDAGDWDRRIIHLILARNLMELALYHHDFFKNMDLNIPESNNDLPDIIDEALFDIDGYKRLQTPEGGIRGGIESSEHPRHGETSWQESLDVIAYAPGIYSSYFYAGVVAFTTLVLEKYYPEIAPDYKESAIKAMEWAEKEYVKNEWPKYKNVIDIYRGLAAIDFYRLTGDTKWHDVFLETFDMKETTLGSSALGHRGAEAYKTAIWQYYMADSSKTTPEIRNIARKILIKEADILVEAGRKTAFGFAKNPNQIIGYGNFSAPIISSIVRAYHITKKEKYLESIILSCQCGAGANPDNICYTTGLGHNFPQNPLHVDSRISCQAPPPGITVFGPVDIHNRKEKWGGWGHRIVNQNTYPKADYWPVSESYWDIFWYPVVCEYTVQKPITQNSYVWGMLCVFQNENKNK